MPGHGFGHDHHPPPGHSTAVGEIRIFPIEPEGLIHEANLGEGVDSPEHASPSGEVYVSDRSRVGG